MAEVEVQTAVLTIVTVPLSVKLIKQMPISDQLLDYRTQLNDVDGKPNPAVIGWVHGSTLEKGEDYWCWLLIALPNHQWVRVRVSKGKWTEKFRQLYIG